MGSTEKSSAFNQALAKHTRLSSDLGELSVDQLSDTFIPELYKLVTEAASETSCRERPFAADEFPILDAFKVFTSCGYVMTFSQVATGDVVGYGFLTPSNLHRNVPPLYGEIRFFLLGNKATEKIMKDVYGYLMELSASMGYRACIIDTFSSNQATIAAAYGLGFQTTCFIPLSGLVPGQGLTECFILQKSISTKELPCPKDPSIMHLPLLRHRLRKRKTATLPLPATSVLQDGTPVKVSYAKEADIPIILNLFRHAIDKGEGFGAADLPPVEQLQAIILGADSGDCFMLDSAGVSVGFIYVGPSIACRSYDAALSDTFIAVEPSFGGKGLGTFLAGLWMWLSHELGYKGVLSDTFISHSIALRIVRKFKLCIVGLIPSGGYLTGKGWTDVVAFFRETYDSDPSYPTLSKL